jgi:hypothetical protein
LWSSSWSPEEEVQPLLPLTALMDQAEPELVVIDLPFLESFLEEAPQQKMLCK